MNLGERLALTNPHWAGRPFPTPVTKRDLFHKLWADIDARPMFFLTGPRRTGKSVLLRQLVADLITVKHIDPMQILFVEFAPQDPTELIWESYQYFTATIANPGRPMIAFFDEVQYLPGYESPLKTLYDAVLQLKIAVTGSLSLSYKRRMQESLAGRFFSYHLFPLHFAEYLSISESPALPSFQKLQSETNPAVQSLYLNEINAVFREFLGTRRLPEMIPFTSAAQSTAYLESVLGQTLNQDAFAYFDIEKPQVLTALFEHIRMKSGGLVSILKLSASLGVSAVTIKKYLDVLELMGVVYVVHNTTNPLVRPNASRKAYVSSMYLLKDTPLDPATAMGFAAESYVLERLLAQHRRVTFFRRRNVEIDFLLPDENAAYEVKFRTSLGSLRTLRTFCKKHRFEPRVITLNTIGKERDIEFIPTCLL